ncbi:MAG: hypothetical protein Q8S33_26835 [Myxococcales bacterium]|nr:hypothetical protein [Myxococcales bacterium]MDP3503983.1 hypothetical protein [Myxococcales bacterium]
MNVAALTISALGVPWGLVASFVIAPVYVKMFADFGSELPQLTQLMVKPWAPVGLALGCFAIVASSTQLEAKWLAVTVSLLTTLAQPTLFVLAMYLPIFAIAGAIK